MCPFYAKGRCWYDRHCKHGKHLAVPEEYHAHLQWPRHRTYDDDDGYDDDYYYEEGEEEEWYEGAEEEWHEGDEEEEYYEEWYNEGYY